MAYGFFTFLADILFPPKCVFCKKALAPSSGPICPKCLKELPYNAKGITGKNGGEFFSLCAAPLLYSGKARESILRFKFHDYTHYAACYGKLMAECISRSLSGRYDLVTWVPLSLRRRKSRGYDQAYLLALAATLELDTVPVELLRKITDNTPQSGLNDQSARKANVLSAYEVTDKSLVEGRKVLVIDDIITTGSTLSECAKTLLAAGAEDVCCAVLAWAK